MSNNNNSTDERYSASLRSLKDKHGKDSFFYCDEKEYFSGDYSTISTGSLSLDLATGINGFPRGRIVEIFGREGSGKSTILLHVLKNSIETAPDKGIAIIDDEHSLDKKYASSIGVPTDKLLISQPDSAEQALDILIDLTSTGEFSSIVLDSVAGLVPMAEIEGSMDKQHMGLTARLMASTCRKLDALAAKSNTLIVFSNQMRDTMGFGKTTAGGNALRYFSSMRVDLKKVKRLEATDKVIGINTTSNIVKNKCGPPFREAMLTIIFGKGISKENEILDFGAKYGIIEKSGPWYSYGEEKLGQGRMSALQWLGENLEKSKEIENKIINIFESESML